MADDGDAERLVVLLEARIRDFEKNMAKASGTATSSYTGMRRSSQTATAQMEADMVRSSTRINNALASTSTRIGAFSKSFAVGAIAALAPLLTFRAALEGTKAALDRFGDIADRAAESGLDVEYFQGIAHGAKLAGVEFDTFSSSLATFAKNSGLAVEGKGKMVTALQALNPVLLENIRNARTQEERLRLAADAINDTADAAKKAALASALFGESGIVLAKAFDGGARGLDAMVAKARQLGIVVDREVIARADELGDQFDTTTQIIDLQLKKALINLGPTLVWLTGLAANLAGEFNFVTDSIKGLQDQATATIERQVEALDKAAALAKSPEMNPLGLPTDIFGVDAAKREELITELRRRAMESLKTQLLATPPATDPLPPLDTTEMDKVAEGLQRLREEGLQLGISLHDPFEQLTADLDHLGAMLNAKAIDWDTFSEAAFQAKANSVAAIAGMASSITGTLAGMFEDNKGFAAANAVVSGIEGVAKTLSAYPAPWSFAMAGVQAAAAAAQVAAILSSTKNSKSMPSAPSGGSAPASAAASTAQGSGNSPTTVYLSLPGASQTVTGEQLRTLIDSLNEMGENGYKLVTDR